MGTFKSKAMIAISLVGLVVTPAIASYKYHPRANEVTRRDKNINRRLNSDYGRLGGNYGKLKQEDRTIAAQEKRDFRQNGGFLTKGEQGQLNKEENRLDRQIAFDKTGKWRGWDVNHPRQAQVLGSDKAMSRELRADRGDLSGQYKNLMSEDRSIKQQDFADAKANGGFITPAQKLQLDQEETQLQQQIQAAK